MEWDGNSIPLQTKGEQRWIALLAYLAIERRRINRRILAQIIWQYEEHSRDRFRRHTLQELKTKIGEEALSVTANTVQLDTGKVWVDANQFLDTLSEAAMCSSTSSNRSLALFEESVAYYQGSFLGNYVFPEIGLFSDWQEEKTELLRHKFSEATQTLITSFFDRGELAKAEHYAALWAKHDKNELQAHAWLLNIFEEQGNREAFARYMRKVKPILEAQGQTKADLYRAREHISQDYSRKLARVFSTNPFPVNEINVPVEEKNLSPFYQHYIDELYELAKRNPLEAVKAAGNISTTLFELMDKPHEVDQMLAKVENLLQSKNDIQNPNVEFHLKLHHLRIYRALGMTEKALMLINEMQDNKNTIQWIEADRETRGDWYHNRGLIRCWIQSDYQAALEDFERARKEFAFAGQIGREVGVIADVGLVAWNLGELDIAEEKLTLSRARLAQISGEQHRLIKISGHLGLVYLSQGKLEDALKSIGYQFNLASDLRFQKEIRRALGNRGIVKFHLGRYDDAIADLKACIQATNAMNEGLAHAQINMSRCYRAKNDLETAHKIASKALQFAEEKQYMSLKLIAKRALAECSSDSQAAYLLQDALALARSSRRRFDEAACLLALANYPESKTIRNRLLQQGKAILEAIGAGYWSKKTSIDLPTL